MSVEIDRFITPFYWKSFEISEIPMKCVNIKIKNSVTVKGILNPKGVVFVPINSESHVKILENIKRFNRKSLKAGNELKYVETFRAMLDVPHGGNTGGIEHGCYTGIEAHLHSTGIEFILNGDEDLAPNQLFERFNLLFSNLKFSRGNPPNGSF